MRKRGVGVGGLVWLALGVVVAWQQDELGVELLARVVSALLAVLLWPLLLLGVNLQLG